MILPIIVNNDGFNDLTTYYGRLDPNSEIILNRPNGRAVSLGTYAQIGRAHV